MPLDEGRLAALVARAIVPALAQRDARIRELETRLATVRDGRDGLPGVPGPPGEKGLDGAPGVDGRPGRDGTWDQVKFVQSDDLRTVTVCFKDGTPIEGGVWQLAGLRYLGPYQAGVTYQAGESVTYGRSQWTALKETAAIPGDGATAWRLSVMHGRDGKAGPEGKPGRDGTDGRPGRDLTSTDYQGRKW